MRTLHRKQMAQALGACLATALFLASAARAAKADAPAVDTSSTAIVVVARGDTLWSIARRLNVPGASLPEKVSAIRARNGLRTSALKPGQTLVVPIGGQGESELFAQSSSQICSTASPKAR